MTNRLLHFVKSNGFALTEGAIIERIRRSEPTILDPDLLNAPLVYSSSGRITLSALHRQYIEIGQRYDLPLIAFSDTWRANKARLEKSGMMDRNVNGDCLRFLRGIIEEFGDYSDHVYIAGLIGCKGDAYNPDESLSKKDAASFHAYQADALAAAGADFLFAATIPSLSEAAGMASVMASTGIPYVISFVLNRRGLILDGTSLQSAVTVIDNTVFPAPLFYMANCCHPAFLKSALTSFTEKETQLFDRIIGLQANTSSKEAHELDNLAFLDSETPDVFAEAMIGLHKSFRTRILGGCCGSDERHIAAIAKRLKKTYIRTLLSKINREGLDAE